MSDKLTPDEFTAAFANLDLWMADEGQTEATMVTVALVIQARATLEVAEQLRIANLIKLADTSLQAETAIWAQNQLNPDIARALQIDKETN